MTHRDRLASEFWSRRETDRTEELIKVAVHDGSTVDGRAREPFRSDRLLPDLPGGREEFEILFERAEVMESRLREVTLKKVF